MEQIEQRLIKCSITIMWKQKCCEIVFKAFNMHDEIEGVRFLNDKW